MRRLIHGLPVALALLSAAVWAQRAENLTITVGKSIVLDYPEDVRQISTSNPDIVDASPATSREILLHGKATGISTVIIWSKSGQRTFYNVTVEQNLEPLRKLLKETFPNEDIHVQASRDSLSLTGRVSSKDVADRAAALSTSTTIKTVVNNLQIVATAADKQILLRVKFAELNRNRSNQFGLNLISTGATNTIGTVTTQQFSPPRPAELTGSIGAATVGTSSTFTISDALNVFAFRPDLNLAATIRALQSEGVLQILAEPNLVTTNGKEASFLVGGEFPIPVLQGGGNAGAVTIQFREFGIRLTFTPVVTDYKSVKMYVRPEVSTIDLANAVTFSGFVIPALASRRMETNIELGEGQSFVIGGLIDDRVQENMSRIPGLSNIPILGALFKSRTETKSKTELVVMVTPEIVTPLLAGDAGPVPVMPREFLGPVEKPQVKITREPKSKKEMKK
jgi:pilus assembly protein CpaC